MDTYLFIYLSDFNWLQQYTVVVAMVLNYIMEGMEGITYITNKFTSEILNMGWQSQRTSLHLMLGNKELKILLSF